MTDQALCPDLLTYAEDRLDPSHRRQVEEHVRGCSDCRRWLETYRTLSGGSSCARQAPSELLARYAVGANQIDEEQRGRLTAHLATCAPCRAELDLARSALESARDKAPTGRASAREVIGTMIGRIFLTPTGAATSAAMLVVLTAIGWVALFSAERSAPSDLTAASVVEAEANTQDQVAMLIANTSVGAGGALAIRSYGSVAFGDGFSVGPGARLRVEIIQSAPDGPEGPTGPENPRTERITP